MTCKHPKTWHPSEIQPVCPGCHAQMMTHARVSETVYVRLVDYPTNHDVLRDGIAPPGMGAEATRASANKPHVHVCPNCLGALCVLCTRPPDGRWPELQGKRMYEGDRCPLC